MSERAESTLGYERLIQPLFKLDQQAFVDEVLGSLPPMPSYYPRMKELNSQGAPSLPGPAAESSLSPVDLSKRCTNSAVTVIDLRRPEAFGGAHIPGALNIGAGQNLSLWAGWLIAPEQRLLLVDEKGETEEAIRSLALVGLERVEGSLHKGMPAWIDAGLEFGRTVQLSTKEVAERSSEVRVLDVRSDKEWQSGHIEGAIHISLGELPDRFAEIPKNQSVIAVCGSGYRSSIAASLLQANGFSEISSMDGGMTAWNSTLR